MNGALDIAAVPAGQRVAIGRRSAGAVAMFDVRVIAGHVSAASIRTYYDAVRRDGLRGAEGWLP